MAIKRSAKVDKFIEVITEAEEYFKELLEKRQETYNNRSEAWQDSDKGEEWSEDLCYLDDVVSNLESAIDTLESLFEVI